MSSDQPHRTSAASSPKASSTDRPLRLGELLVRQGLLTAQQVSHLLDVQAVTGRPFGDLAERLFGVEPKAVSDAWVEQFLQQSPPQDVAHEVCESHWLKLLDRRQAWQFRIVPLRREADHLLIAADARGLLKAMNFAGRTFPLAPCVVVADEASLSALLMRHYPVPPHLASYAFKR